MKAGKTACSVPDTYPARTARKRTRTVRQRLVRLAPSCSDYTAEDRSDHLGRRKALLFGAELEVRIQLSPAQSQVRTSPSSSLIATFYLAPRGRERAMPDLEVTHGWSVQRPGGRPVREPANGIGKPAPHGHAVVIVLSGEFPGACGAFLDSLSPYRLSIRLAARQMSISGITGTDCTLWIAIPLT